MGAFLSILCNDPQIKESKAAITIQASTRGMLSRIKYKSLQKSDLTNPQIQHSSFNAASSTQILNNIEPVPHPQQPQAIQSEVTQGDLIKGQIQTRPGAADPGTVYLGGVPNFKDTDPDSVFQLSQSNSFPFLINSWFYNRHDLKIMTKKEDRLMLVAYNGQYEVIDHESIERLMDFHEENRLCDRSIKYILCSRDLGKEDTKPFTKSDATNPSQVRW